VWNPEFLYDVIVWEVTHMLGDGHVGVHHWGLWLGLSRETVKSNSLLLITCSLCLLEIWLLFMLETMLRQYDIIVRTRGGRVPIELTAICFLELSHSFTCVSYLRFLLFPCWYLLLSLLDLIVWFLRARVAGKVSDWDRTWVSSRELCEVDGSGCMPQGALCLLMDYGSGVIPQRALWLLIWLGHTACRSDLALGIKGAFLESTHPQWAHVPIECEYWGLRAEWLSCCDELSDCCPERLYLLFHLLMHLVSICHCCEICERFYIRITWTWTV